MAMEPAFASIRTALRRAVRARQSPWTILCRGSASDALGRDDEIASRGVELVGGSSAGRSSAADYSRSYYYRNRERILEQKRIAYANKREQILEKERIRYQENRSHILSVRKSYYDEKRDEIVRQKQEAYEKRRESILASKKESLMLNRLQNADSAHQADLDNLKRSKPSPAACPEPQRPADPSNSLATCMVVVEVLRAAKVKDIVVINLADPSTVAGQPGSSSSGSLRLADQVVFCTGNSSRHLASGTEQLRLRFSKPIPSGSGNIGQGQALASMNPFAVGGPGSFSADGRPEDGWICVRVENVLIHLMAEEVRLSYGLDRKWALL